MDFEQFLERVLVNLGYDVNKTGGAGDQGCDLIARKNGRKVAIQAKGWKNSVGNDAVHKAHFAKSFYDCHACVVITNSDGYTRHAILAAEKVGCDVLRNCDIPKLIAGEINL